MRRFTSVANPLYPPVEPHASGFMAVDGGHAIYWETCGNPQGIPALFLHGGPGGGCSAQSRRFFDPARYRVILFDQRGCGRSTPAGSLESNTTAHLIDDIDALRRVFGIDRWLLLGGSWGTTLALAYALHYLLHVSALVLRAVFTARRAEIDWLYHGGAAHIFPEAWTRFATFIPERERNHLLRAYHARLTSPDDAMVNSSARAWCVWEDALATLLPGPLVAEPIALRSLARIEAHYFIHRAFLEEGELIASAPRLRGIPGVIVQGRYDAVTPPATAWELHQSWPGSRLCIVPDAGHASSEPGIARELVNATDEFATRFAGE